MWCRSVGGTRSIPRASTPNESAHWTTFQHCEGCVSSLLTEIVVLHRSSFLSPLISSFSLRAPHSPSQKALHRSSVSPFPNHPVLEFLDIVVLQSSIVIYSVTPSISPTCHHPRPQVAQHVQSPEKAARDPSQSTENKDANSRPTTYLGERPSTPINSIVKLDDFRLFRRGNDGGGLFFVERLFVAAGRRRHR